MTDIPTLSYDPLDEEGDARNSLDVFNNPPIDPLELLNYLDQPHTPPSSGASSQTHPSITDAHDILALFE